MTQERYSRNQRDLLDIISNLQRRIEVLETSPRLGQTSIDSGELVLRGGDIVVKNDNGETVLQILHGNVPTILMQPSGGGGTDYRAYQYGWESQAAGTSYQAGIEDANGVQDGSKLLLMQGGCYLSYQPNGAEEAYLSIAAWDGLDEHFYVRGRWPNDLVGDSHTGLVMGSVNIAAGVSSYSHTYSTPLATAPGVVYGLVNTAGAVTHSLTASSASGFTVTWSGTLAKTLHWWAFRL